MTSTTGKRRIDRVLGEGFLDGLTVLPLEDVRRLRAEAEQEETDISYLRRMLQGRIDILRAELARRSGAAGSDLLEALPQILADHARPPARGLGRHVTTEPTRLDRHRRGPEMLLAEIDLDDLAGRSTSELEAGLTKLQAAERVQSEARAAVQQVMDACSSEITRRYRDGEAHVTDLLTS